MNTLFPIFLVADKLKFLIIGGGNVGLEKLFAIKNQSDKALVKILAPNIKEEIKQSVSFDNLIFDYYSKKYLAGYDIVIVCTDSPETNKEVWADCKALKILVNVADTPDFCDFYLGSIVKKGDLKIAISTNGKSPTFAKRFREVLEEILPDSIQEVLNNLYEIRNKLKGDFSDKVQKLNEITEVMKKKD